MSWRTVSAEQSHRWASISGVKGFRLLSVMTGKPLYDAGPQRPGHWAAIASRSRTAALAGTGEGSWGRVGGASGADLDHEDGRAGGQVCASVRGITRRQAWSFV